MTDAPETIRTTIHVSEKEPVFLSWMRDAVTFGFLFGALLLNYYLLGNDGFLLFFICFVWFIWLLGKSFAKVDKNRIVVTEGPAKVRELLAPITEKE